MLEVQTEGTDLKHILDFLLLQEKFDPFCVRVKRGKLPQVFLAEVLGNLGDQLPQLTGDTLLTDGHLAPCRALRDRQ